MSEPVSPVSGQSASVGKNSVACGARARYDSESSVLTRTLLVILAVTLSCTGQGTPEFGLFLHFDSTPSPQFLRTMKQELAVVLAGFALHWIVKGDSAAESRTYSRAFIVRFRGTCAVIPGQRGSEPEEPIVLGDTVTSEGRILPYSEIDCDRLQAFLRTAHLSEAGQEARLGRAGGRVLAHELYHVLLQTPEHARKGLARAVYTPAALVSQSLLFEEGELGKIALRYKP